LSKRIHDFKHATEAANVTQKPSAHYPELIPFSFFHPFFPYCFTLEYGKKAIYLLRDKIGASTRPQSQLLMRTD
jgi:hypothetical protein